LFDGQHRKAIWTLEEAAGAQAITTEKTSVASRAFEENQVAVDRASAKNLLQHIVSSPGSPHRLDRADKESGLGTEAESLPAFTSATVLEQFRGGPKYPWLLDESAMAKQRELPS
jgi:hypothetical protein